MGVMKQPLIDAGLLNATQLGIIGACLYWACAIGKFINGFLADSANIKRFMALGLIVSVAMNFVMGILGVSALVAALGIVGMASYAAAGLQNVVTGLLPILNWKRKRQDL